MISLYSDFTFSWFGLFVGDVRGMCLLPSSCCSAAAEEALDRYSRRKLSSDITATHSYMQRTFAHLETTLQGECVGASVGQPRECGFCITTGCCCVDTVVLVY